MKIVLCVGDSGVGGIQRHVIDIAASLRSSGNEVVVLLQKEGPLTQELEKKEIETRIFPDLHLTWRSWATFCAMGQIYRALQEFKPDILHIHDLPPLFVFVANALLGKKKAQSVFTFHGLDLLAEGWKGSRVKRLLWYLYVRLCVRFADRVVFITEKDRQRAQKIGIVRKTQRNTVIYNGIARAEKSVSKEETRKKLGEFIGKPLSENVFVIGTIARLHYQKNIELLIRASVGLDAKTCHLCVIGDGPEREKLLQLRRELGQEEMITLGQGHMHAAEFLEAFDAFVLPSRYEGLPYVLLEAAEAKIPIIASDVDGVKEFISPGEHGIIFRPDDAEDLKKALIAIQEKDEKIQRAAESLQIKRREMFTLEKMMADLMRVYESVH